LIYGQLDTFVKPKIVLWDILSSPFAVYYLQLKVADFHHRLRNHTHLILYPNQRPPPTILDGVPLEPRRRTKRKKARLSLTSFQELKKPHQSPSLLLYLLKMLAGELSVRRRTRKRKRKALKTHRNPKSPSPSLSPNQQLLRIRLAGALLEVKRTRRKRAQVCVSQSTTVVPAT
jgi:hypothetical protein